MTLRTWLPLTLAAGLLGLAGCSAEPDPTSRPTSSAASTAAGSTGGTATTGGATAGPEVSAVWPGLAKYHDQTVLALWDRPQLSARDRSLATVAALVSTHQTDGLAPWVGKALDDGVTATELSEALIQLGFYSGWQNAVDAVPVVASVFDQRGIGADVLPPADPTLTVLDGAALKAEQARAAQVESSWGDLFPGVVESTNRDLFGDVWLRPGLAPRDRSLVTVVTLVTTSQPDQLTYHLNRGLDSGLTSTEAGELMNQLAYFVGWPKVFTALPVVKDVLESR